MDLFEQSAQRRRLGQPLAERMRPRSFDEIVGQRHLLGVGKILSNSGGGSLPSLVLFGPPGTGKTTIARLLAERVRAALVSLSAVSAGVKDVRAAVAEARTRLVERGHRTVLFLDEIHRFSKSQQDALLPHVEAGTIILIGATTENPSFEVNAALLSRVRVLRLEALTPADLEELLDRALADRERGLGELGLSLSPDARAALLAGTGGDARRLLGALEVAAAMCSETRAVDREHIEEALQQRTLLYDKAGDEHYGVVSAFIKSLRGSDPDAAVYWMTRMLEAGEDPLFVLRRMVIFASEDVGNADPAALGVVTAALDAFRFVGMPEGALSMTQAAVYLACAAKSNTSLTTYAAARAAVRETGSLPVPAVLRNATSALAKSQGHGAGYRYPHNFSGKYVAETYLPEALAGARFYQPTDSGHEIVIAERLAALRRGTPVAQLTAGESSRRSKS